MKTWKARVQDTYDSVTELAAFNACYNVAQRCGYVTAQEMWDANPVIGGSVDPSDFGKVSD